MFDLEKAACLDSDPVIFFPDSPSNYTIRVRQAKKICATCPVALQCLAQAIDGEEFGIWGGTTEVERRSMSIKKKVEILKHLQ
jgi:WhiB family redox-sensing transcriptional regulator